MSEPTPTEIMEAIAKLATEVKHMRSALEIRIDALTSDFAHLAAEFGALRLDIQSDHEASLATANATFAGAVHSLTDASKALTRRVAALEAKA